MSRLIPVAIAAATSCVGAPCSAAEAAAETAPAAVNYQEQVKPILREHCFACHSQDDASSGLALDDYSAVLAGGVGGEVVAAGDPEASRLWLLMSHQEGPVMPPGEKIPDEQLVIIKQWIEGGLRDNAGSKPKKAKRSALAAVTVAVDNRPAGEPAMPQGWLRQPVVASPRVGPVSAIAASPWAPLAAVAWQRQVALYDIGPRGSEATADRLLGVLPYPSGVPNVVRFSRDGSVLLVAGGAGAKSGSASLFDVKTGDRLATVGDELDTVLAADVSRDLSLVAIGGPKRKVRVYRTDDGSLAYTLGKHTDWVTALEFSPDGELLATADRSAGVLLWQAATGNARADLRGHKGPITAVGWRADSAALATASEDGDVRLWSRDGRSLKKFTAHKPGAMAVAFTSKSEIVTAGRDRRAKLWSAEGKQQKKFGKLADLALAAATSPDASRIVASDFTGVVTLFDAASQQPIATLAANPPTLGERVASAAEALAEAERAIKPARAEQVATATELSEAEAALRGYEARLAEAAAGVKEAKRTQAQRRRDTDRARRRLADAEQAESGAKSAVETARAALAVAQEKLAAPDSGDDSPGAVVQSLTRELEQAEAASRQRRKETKAVRERLAGASNAADAAGAALKQAEATLAKIRGQRRELPDLKAARARAEAADQGLVAAEQRLAGSGVTLAAAKAELAAYEDHPEALNHAAQQRTAEQRRLAAAAESAEAAATQQQATAETLASQIAALKRQLDRLRPTGKKAASEAEKLQTAAAAAREQAAIAEAAKAAAEDRRAAFEAAEAERQKHLHAAE